MSKEYLRYRKNNAARFCDDMPGTNSDGKSTCVVNADSSRLPELPRLRLHCHFGSVEKDA
jgi:hypothetical protein